MDNPWVVYILECADGTLYTGITNNLSKRISTHNKGKGSKFVKSRLPATLVCFWELENKSKALKEEYRIKKLSRTSKLELIKSCPNRI